MNPNTNVVATILSTYHTELSIFNNPTIKKKHKNAWKNTKTRQSK